MKRLTATRRADREATQRDLEAHIARMFKAIDAIDLKATKKRYPNRGSVPCPNCGGRLAYVNLTPLKGAGRCSTPDCVEFAPLY